MDNKGSFDNLYSLKDASILWRIDESSLRKHILNGVFVINKDVKKFGKQWVITKEAMENKYGLLSNELNSDNYNKNTLNDINSFISNCLILYSIKSNKNIDSALSIFKKYNLINYLYDNYDYLHLGNLNNVIVDINSRIKKDIKYGI